MSAPDDYRAVDPEVADALERFGLITPEQADLNYERFDQELDNFVNAWNGMREAWEEHCRQEHSRFGRLLGSCSWPDKEWSDQWLEENDPMGTSEVLAARRKKARES